jgi:hypothetical protein
MNEKYTIMSPFDITSKMLGPYMFSATARESLGDKMELYFQDHSFMPLFIQVCLVYVDDYILSLTVSQENYLKTDPAKLRNYDGPMKQVKALELMDKAASSISDGDLVDALIHGCVILYIPEDIWVAYSTQARAALVSDAFARCVLHCSTRLLPLRHRRALWRS